MMDCFRRAVHVISTKTVGPYIAGTTKRLELAARISGQWSIAVDGNTEMSGADSRLTASGALASGKSGLYDRQDSATGNTRTYSNFSVAIPVPQEAVMYPGRSMVWDHDGGVRREASGGTYYGYAAGQQGVGRPMLGPAGTEGLSNRLTIASADISPDDGANANVCPRLDYEVKMRPAYLLGRHEN